MARPAAEDKRVPWFTLAMLAANLGAYTFSVFRPGLSENLAFSSFDPKLTTAFSSIFLHGNLLHLLANMVFLAAVGPLLEFTKGWWVMALTYLAGGMAGVGAFWAMTAASGSDSTLLGASGAIAACVAVCSILFLRTKVPVAPNLAVPVGVMTLSWLVIQVTGAFVSIGIATEGGGFWAHIGGFLAGLVASLVFGATTDAKLQYRHEVLDKMNERNPDALLATVDTHLRDHPDDVQAWLKKIDAHESVGETDAAIDATLSALEHADDDDRAALIAHLVRFDGLDRLDSSKKMRLADSLPESAADQKQALYLSIANNDRDVRQPDALYSLLALLGPLHTEGQSAAEKLAADYPLHPATSAARQRGLMP